MFGKSKKYYFFCVLVAIFTQSSWASLNYGFVQKLCDELKRRCSAEDVVREMSELQELSQEDVLEAVKSKFFITFLDRSTYPLVPRLILDDTSVLAVKKLMRAGASFEEAVYLGTFYSDVPVNIQNKVSESDKHLLLLYRFQKKTSKNKNICLNNELLVNKKTFCESVKACSVTCEKLNQPTIKKRGDVIPHQQKVLGERV